MPITQRKYDANPKPEAEKSYHRPECQINFLYLKHPSSPNLKGKPFKVQKTQSQSLNGDMTPIRNFNSAYTRTKVEVNNMHYNLIKMCKQHTIES